MFCHSRNQRARVKGGYGSFEHTLYRARRKNRPARIPATVEDCEALLETPHLNALFGIIELLNGPEVFYKTTFVHNNPTSMVFACNNRETTNIHIDGTFKVVPYKLKVLQLFSLHIVKENHTFPVVLALMSNKTTEGYVRLLQ
jgi:MULE transposase domain